MNKISIIIPTYNRASLLKRSLDSVVNQNSVFEVIIVDDCGKDNTKSIVESYKEKLNIIYIRHSKNGGVNTARNTAIRNASGDWLVFLDDDDELVPNAINVISEKICKLPNNISVMYFNSIIDNGVSLKNGGFQFYEGEKEYDPTYEDTMNKFRLRGDCKPVFRKTLFSNNSYIFPETVNGYESYSMSLMARDNVGIRYFSDVTTHIHFDNSVSHLSHTAPKKNPKPLLDLHIKQISEHSDFYKKNRDRLKDKYLVIAKLSYRAKDVKNLILYVFRFLLCKIETQ